MGVGGVDLALHNSHQQSAPAFFGRPTSDKMMKAFAAVAEYNKATNMEDFHFTTGAGCFTGRVPSQKRIIEMISKGH